MGTESLSNIDSEHAEAAKEHDKHKVQKAIRESVGFESVNSCVKDAMIDWIGHVVQQKMRETVHAGRTEDAPIVCPEEPVPDAAARESSWGLAPLDSPLI